MNRFEISRADSNVPMLSKRGPRFATKEQVAARKHNTAAPYFRLIDPICKGFMQQATDPREFEGLKLLFPFVREMSLLRFEPTLEKLGVWMQLAFLAGHDLGHAHPERLEDVLPGPELGAAERRLGVLAQCAGEERLTFDGLSRACARIAKTEGADTTQDELTSLIVVAVIKTLRVGYAAATTAQYE